MEEKRVWGTHSEYDASFLERGIIGIGWKEMGNLSDIQSNREAYKEKYSTIFPNSKKMAVAVNAGQLYRYVCEALIGDFVVYSQRGSREISIGVIEGDFFLMPMYMIMPINLR